MLAKLTLNSNPGMRLDKFAAIAPFTKAVQTPLRVGARCFLASKLPLLGGALLTPKKAEWGFVTKTCPELPGLLRRQKISV